MSSSNLFGMLYYCVLNIVMNNFLQGEYVILDDSVIGTSCNSPYTYVAAFGTTLQIPWLWWRKPRYVCVLSMEMAVVCSGTTYTTSSIRHHYLTAYRFSCFCTIKLSSTLPIATCVSVLLDSLFKVCLFVYEDSC